MYLFPLYVCMYFNNKYKYANMQIHAQKCVFNYNNDNSKYLFIFICIYVFFRSLFVVGLHIMHCCLFIFFVVFFFLISIQFVFPLNMFSNSFSFLNTNLSFILCFFIRSYANSFYF